MPTNVQEYIYRWDEKERMNLIIGKRRKILHQNVLTQ